VEALNDYVNQTILPFSLVIALFLPQNFVLVTPSALRYVVCVTEYACRETTSPDIGGFFRGICFTCVLRSSSLDSGAMIPRSEGEL
jgi:hypothetical protein